MPRRAVALLVLVTVLCTGGYLATVRGRGAGAAPAQPGPSLPTLPSAAGPGHDTATAPGGTWRVPLPDGRSYVLAAPGRPPTTGRLPLLLVVHGKTGNAEQFAETSGFTGYAERGEAVVAFPDATEPRKGRSSWNAGTCCEPAVGLRVDDLGYLAGVIADVSARTRVDSARTWYVGYSNGAMLGYRLACERPDLVDAVVAVAGARVSASCTPRRPLPFLHVHGDRDRAVPIDGTAWSEGLRTPLPSQAASVQPIATAGGCTGWSPPEVTGDLARQRALGCQAPVERVRVHGLAHRWDARETTLAWSFLASR